MMHGWRLGQERKIAATKLCVNQEKRSVCHDMEFGLAKKMYGDLMAVEGAAHFQSDET